MPNINIRATESQIAALKARSEARDQTVTEIIKGALALEAYLDNEIRGGGKLYIKERNGSMTRLVLPADIMRALELT